MISAFAGTTAQYMSCSPHDRIEIEDWVLDLADAILERMGPLDAMGYALEHIPERKLGEDGWFLESGLRGYLEMRELLLERILEAA